MNFNTLYKAIISQIDEYISNFLQSNYGSSSPMLLDAMKYSVLNGGKRLRSILCLETAKMLGLPYEKAMPFASAIELIHAYSLVHDDLPCMDNADYRRGKESCHKKYGETMGVLCGDALLNSAYELMSMNCENQSDINAMKLISAMAGGKGMVDGQVIDLGLSDIKPTNADTLTKLIELKTMALIKASVLSGVLLADADDEVYNDMDKFSYHLGLAFQIRDDFEDIEQDSSDDNGSPNFINFLGYEKAKELLDMHSQCAKEILLKYENSDFLKSLHGFLFES